MIAVTGATGLLGAHLVYKLIEEGYQVKTLYRSSATQKNLLRVFSFYTDTPQAVYSQIIWVKGDVTDLVSLEDFLERGDRVFHCAGMVSFYGPHWKQLHRINAEGTANVVLAAMNKGVEKLVHASSTSVLDRSVAGLIDEQAHWKGLKGSSWYGLTKMLGEREIWRAQAEGMPTAIVNPAIILGPAGNWKQGSARLFHSVAKGFPFYTQGVNAFVDVRDVAEAMIMLMNEPIENERFVLAAQNMEYRKLFELIAKTLDVSPPKYMVKQWMTELAWRVAAASALFRKGEPMITKETAKSAMQKNYYDGTKITRTLNFHYTPLKETINITGKFYQASPHS